MNSPYGQIAWWGFSPSLDIIKYMKTHEVNETKAINVLLVGSADNRHILHTLSNLHDFDGKINFYLVESNLENLSRQMLLTNLVLEPTSELNTQEKSEMYLELFGNSLLRHDTEDYLVARSNEYVKMITEPSYSEKKYPYFDFSNLKFKEVDQLESIFKFWRNTDTDVFNIGQMWDNRVRAHLGVRYDSRDNAFDWEFSMSLKEKASIVNWNEFKRWRANGLAFVLRDETAYVDSNKTLASGLIFKKDGERIPKRGYWGDILNSPYVAFGIESENEALFKKANNVHTQTATDVSMYNVKSLMNRVLTGKDVENESESDGVIIEEVSENDAEGDLLSHIKEKFKMVFLPLDCVSSLHKKSKFKRRFDMVFFSNSMVHCLDNSISGLFRDKESLLVIESTKFMLDLKAEMHEEYSKKIKGMASTAHCQPCKEFNFQQDSYAVFKYQGE